ncbi:MULTISPECIES: hypothetical protein [Shewanella]|uniref:hypothetical protein n=1 Tax=Shewanella TaxID=22 RepID=UPI00048A70A8|nr:MULTISPECIES: hypothetical protein [Shewanella]
MRKTMMVTALCAALVGCASTDEANTSDAATVAPESVTLGGMSNEAAADALLAALLKKNYLASKVSPTRVGVQFDKSQFVLQPSINAEGIDRILMNRFYAIHPKMAGSKELLLLIGTLNHKLNFAKFTLRENGNVIQVQGAATFVNTIDLEEIRRFMLWTDDGLHQVGLSLPKGSEELIKPIPIMKNPVST